MSAFANRASKSLLEIRDRFEASTSLVAAFVGIVIGTLVTLAIVVAVGLFIGRSFPWVTVALGVIVSIAAIDTILETLFAMLTYRQLSIGELSRHVAPYVLASKIVELAFFAVAALVLLHVI